MASDIDDDAPTFAVEQEFFGGQVRLVPDFSPGDLVGPDQARYGQLRNEVRSDGAELVLPLPMSRDFVSGESVTLQGVYRRLADAPSGSLSVSDKLIAAVVIACMVVVAFSVSAVRTLLGR